MNPYIGRTYRHYDPSKMQTDFKRELENSRFDRVIAVKCPTEASIILSNAIIKATDMNAPVKEFKPRKNDKRPPWYTPEIVEMIGEKEYLLWKNQSLRTPNTKNALKAITNKLKSLKRKTKKNHYSNKIEGSYQNESK